MIKSGGKRIEGLLLGCRHFIFVVLVVGNRVRGRVMVVMIKSGGKRIEGLLLGCRHFIFVVLVVGNRVRVVE
jgi:glutamate racemase